MKKLISTKAGPVCTVTGLAIAIFWVSALQTPALAEAPASFEHLLVASNDGQQIYEHICQGCHMPDAKGAVGAGYYPALSGDRALASKQFMALTLLIGRRNMPAFSAKHAIAFGGPAPHLSYTQIAAVINYVRSHFGNHFKDSITPEEVTALDEP